MSSSGNAFGNNAANRKIYVPARAIEAYTSDTTKGWSTYINDVETF